MKDFWEKKLEQMLDKADERRGRRHRRWRHWRR
jgi:hypothetical protein